LYMSNIWFKQTKFSFLWQQHKDFVRIYFQIPKQ
jgi:hypothetical protein